MTPAVRKAFLKSLGLNTLGGIAGMVPFSFLNGDALVNWGIILIFAAAVSLFLQLITGIVYQFDSRKEAGQGMLLSVGIILLIGLGVCSLLLNW